jgi:hypothetical protein
MGVGVGWGLILRCDENERVLGRGGPGGAADVKIEMRAIRFKKKKISYLKRKKKEMRNKKRFNEMWSAPRVEFLANYQKGRCDGQETLGK